MTLSPIGVYHNPTIGALKMQHTMLLCIKYHASNLYRPSWCCPNNLIFMLFENITNNQCHFILLKMHITKGILCFFFIITKGILSVQLESLTAIILISTKIVDLWSKNRLIIIFTLKFTIFFLYINYLEC